MTVQNISQMPVRVCGATLRPYSLAEFDDAAWTGWLAMGGTNRDLVGTRLKVIEEPKVVDLPDVEASPAKKPAAKKPSGTAKNRTGDRGKSRSDARGSKGAVQ